MELDLNSEIGSLVLSDEKIVIILL
jgi:hypothetical protein